MAVEYRIADLVPHAGGMCLLERVLDWNAQWVRCATSTHRDPANPLATPRGLRAVHLCEYGAQATAVHGSLCATLEHGVAAAGLLVSLRDVTLGVAELQTLQGDLVVTAERVQASAAAWQYRFRISHAGLEIASGRATVAMGRARPA